MSLTLVQREYGRAMVVQSLMAKTIHMMNPASYLHNDNCVELPHDLVSAQAVAAAGAQSISPMLYEYDWPGMKKPYKHQYKVCSFLTTNKRAYCFADMGTGKSLSCVWAVDYLIKIGAVKKVLILSPISVMRPTWAAEFFAVNPALSVTVLYHKDKDKRVKLAAEKTPIHIINYDGLKVIENEIRANMYDLVIIDECTTYSDPSTKKWKLASSLFKNTKYVWGLTGTPTLRGPEAAYGQAALITPNTVAGVSKYKFKERVLRQIGSSFLWVERPDANEQVAAILKPAIRIRKKDCIDLPPVTTIYRELELSAGQKQFYAKLKAESYVEDEQLTLSAKNGAVLMNKLIQIATGAIYADDGQAHKFDVSNRVRETMDFIDRARAESDDKSRGKTLVFVPFKHTAEMVRRELVAVKEDGKTKYDVAVITGDTSEKERAAIFDKFQNSEEVDVVIATPQTMSHGVTATSASCIVWFGPCTSAETYVQACNRIDRPGQRNDMTIVHLYSTPVEWKLYKSLQDSKVSQADLLQMYKDFIQGI